MRDKMPDTEDQVKLKPFMGIRPGVYLTVLYSILLLFILFLILVLPGLREPGAVIVLKTEPGGAALRLDGVYRGTSADRIFVSKGPHVLEAVLPGFKPEAVAREIPGRVFGSRFFPLRYPLEFTLKTDDPAGVFANAAADFAAWSFGGEPTAVWQIPLSLSEGAYRTGPSYDAELAGILTAAARFSVTRAGLRDLVRAAMLLDNGGLSPSPASIMGSVSQILLFLSENPGSAQWLSGLLPPESASALKASDWYKNQPEAKDSSALPQAGSSARRLELAGLSFIEVERAEGSSFLISENPVPRALYDTFLNENPSWRKEEEPDFFPDMPPLDGVITGVSWFAANAFCQRLGGRLPSSMAGREVRLPAEDEWESAALLINHSGWEWCTDPYAPLPFIQVSAKAAEAVGSPERSIRSGLAPQVRAGSENRSSLPPEFSSPFVTFRPVIALKGD